MTLIKNKFYIVALLTLFVSGNVIAKEYFSFGVVMPFDSLDQWQGSDTEAGFGIEFTHHRELFSFHFTAIASGEMQSVTDIDNQSVRVDADYIAYALAISADKRITQSISAYAKLGGSFYDNTYTFETQAPIKATASKLLFGALGAKYRLDKSWEASFEYHSGYSSIVEKGLVQLGVHYRY